MKTAAAAAVAMRAANLMAQASTMRPLLLRSGWQAVNIGDIGHTPGAIEIVQRYCPGRPIILWPSRGGLDLGAGDFLRRNFPSLRIVEGSVHDGKPDTPELAAAWQESGFLLHSSGSGFPAWRDVQAWSRGTGKPYGVFPVSTDPSPQGVPGPWLEGGTLSESRAASLSYPPGSIAQDFRQVIEQSKFMFTRDTISLGYLRAQGVHPPLLEMGPDTQFGMTLKDTARGDAYMKANGLQPHKFICAIPRLRYTINPKTGQAPNEVRAKINSEHVQHDMEMLLDVIVRYVRATGNKVLVCAEMTYQIALGKEYLVDRFPAELKDKLVFRDTFWMPDEAAAIYAQASAVVGFECHSPIIALVQGTPAFYIRQPTDTCKGQMYPDLGAGAWQFEADKTSADELWRVLQGILANPVAARRKALSVLDTVHAKQAVMGKALQTALTAMDAGTPKQS
ncbi:polysaccharide pyruvyl transferase family protein [Terriglobus sp. TAA 43]|uniref:polysaccharide pyruvyl transferase family protein n=1 Tax=Terriglobus sp. TAA 43 TaxID=278961 RepID=UPI000690AD4C|nr:polysaccharide pyruvyl transferase family protein [Terriglobus sp. TAA 43]